MGTKMALGLAREQVDSEAVSLPGRGSGVYKVGGRILRAVLHMERSKGLCEAIQGDIQEAAGGRRAGWVLTSGWS